MHVGGSSCTASQARQHGRAAGTYGQRCGLGAYLGGSTSKACPAECDTPDEILAELLEVPPMKVYEVATFYTMFNREPVGKYHIQLCGTTPCMVAGCGAETIKKTITDELGIGEGETTEDGLFTLTEVECLGACVNAPMIQVNNKEFYEHLTPESMRALLDTWRSGGTPKEGNQNGVKTCEGPQGKTTLKAEPGMPQFVDIDALVKEKAEADAKKAQDNQA